MSPPNEPFLKEYICSNCHVAILEPHPTLHNWVKCRICAFCKNIENKNNERITGNDTTRREE